MQKSSVKTLSIIDTLSELAHDENETSRLAMPSPIAVQRGVHRMSGSGQRTLISGPPIPPGSSRGLQPPPPPPPPSNLGQPPKLQPRSPKVSVPTTSPALSTPPAPSSLSPFGGAKTRFSASSPKKTSLPDLSPRFQNQDGLPVSPLTNGNLRPFNASSNSPRKVGKTRTSGSRGQTPDWIRDIFTFAKRGNSDKLAKALDELEPTLIRNLTDHSGNNLLHTVCLHGHVQMLPWLTSKFGSELSDALNDENRSGITPPLAAVKRGRLECIKWLVRHNTGVRERLSSTTTTSNVGRERSLIHEAAKYGKDEIIDWLADELSRLEIDVDHPDNSGNTPLHLAMRKGNIPTVALLLGHGANINSKNDMGLTPGDCARLSGRRDCAEYLLLYETSMSITKELRDVQIRNEQLQNEQAELRTNFKDLLSIGKRLTREREEMSNELGKLQSTVMELHDKLIMEIQVLSQENNSFRKNNLRHDEDISSSMTIDECTSLHEKWRQYQRQWFFAHQSDFEQKLVMADEVFRKTRSSVNNLFQNNSSDGAQSQRKLRERLEELRALHMNFSIKRGSYLFSSSDDDCLNDGDDDYDDLIDDDDLGNVPHQPQRRVTPDISRRKKMPTPTPSLEDSVYSSLSNEMYSKIGSPTNKFQSKSPEEDQDERRKENRDELRRKLKECALVSESGSASVIEVIEPTSSEEEEFERSLRQLNLGWNLESGQKSTGGHLQSLENGKPVDCVDSLKSPELLEEHFVDENSFEVSFNDIRKKKKGNFLEKIGLRTKKLVKKSPSPVLTPVDSSGTPRTIYSNVPNEADIEEHVLPDSFDDENFFETHENSHDNVKVDITAIRRKFEFSKDENASTTNPNIRGNFDSRRHASLSPSSRKLVLRAGTNYRSSTTSAVSANSLAVSEDSGIVVLGPRPNSSASGKPSPSPPTSICDNNDANEIKLKSVNTSQFVIGKNLRKIEEAASPVGSSRCSSSTGHSKPEFSEVKTQTEHKVVKNQSVKRAESSRKAWYDVPSDEDPEIPEADSLASIISNRSSSEEDF